MAKTNLVYCEQHASIFLYVLPAFTAVRVTGVFLLRLMFLCEDTFDVAPLHRLVPEQHMQKHCSRYVVFTLIYLMLPRLFEEDNIATVKEEKKGHNKNTKLNYNATI